MSALYASNPHMTISELRESGRSHKTIVAYLRQRVEVNGPDSKSGKRAVAEIARLTGTVSTPAPAVVTPAKVARKTGPGSRGGNPSKWLHGQIAVAFGPYGSPAWVAARSASKGVRAKNHTLAAQLLASKVAEIASLTGLTPVTQELVDA